MLSCSQGGRPILKSSAYTVDLGKIKADTLYERSVALYNIGEKDLRISRLSSDCGCTNVSIEKTLIQSNDSTILHVTLETQGKIGLVDNIVCIEANTDSLCHFIQVIGNVSN